MTTDINPQKIPKYYCEECKYGTANKKDFKKHTMTAKHRMVYNGIQNGMQKSPFSCVCQINTIIVYNCYYNDIQSITDRL